MLILKQVQDDVQQLNNRPRKSSGDFLGVNI
jgi:hypothetical protein